MDELNALASIALELMAEISAGDRYCRLLRELRLLSKFDLPGYVRE